MAKPSGRDKVLVDVPVLYPDASGAYDVFRARVSLLASNLKSRRKAMEKSKEPRGQIPSRFKVGSHSPPEFLDVRI